MAIMSTKADREIHYRHTDKVSGLRQEVDMHGNHRLVRPNGEKTCWAPHTAYATMVVSGVRYVGFTTFYLDKEGILEADEFVEKTAYQQ